MGFIHCSYEYKRVNFIFQLKNKFVDPNFVNCHFVYFDRPFLPTKDVEVNTCGRGDLTQMGRS